MVRGWSSSFEELPGAEPLKGIAGLSELFLREKVYDYWVAAALLVIEEGLDEDCYEVELFLWLNNWLNYFKLFMFL